MGYKPKIAFMTTLGINVGDEFIREGICSFLDEVFEEWEPFYVNKHNLLSLHEPCEGEMAVLEDKFRDADIIIQAGAPVYWKLGKSTCYNVEWAEELWQNRIFRLGPEKPILNIAAGACQPYPDFAKTFLTDLSCVQFARNVSHACRWTSVRDPLASQILYSLGLEHDVLPCTAFHAARRTNIQGDHDQVVGINVMPQGGHFNLKDDISEDTWRTKIAAFLPNIRKYHPISFIAHDLSEKEFMAQFLEPGEAIFYSPHWRDYLPVYAKCSSLIANRVHGAVCAAGFGIPSVILGNDTRLLTGDYIGIPSHYISEVSTEKIIDLLETGLATREKEKDRLLTLREESAARYREAMLECLPEFSGTAKPQNVKKSISQKIQKNLSLASVAELSSTLFQDFMTTLNCFAHRLGLRQFTNGSKTWEYPWLWFNGLEHMDWSHVKLLDLGSELSPMPWFIASLGARVTLVEHDDQWVPAWEKIARETGLDVRWHVVTDEHLPFSERYFDVVTSFSVIEHQHDKNLAVDEVARVLKPGGRFAISFDICEPDMGMTFPEWNGKALTLNEFEELIWENPAFGNTGNKAEWNVDDCAEFIKWHLQSAPHHNYVVGAAVLKKKNAQGHLMPDKVGIKQYRNILIPRFDTFGDIVLLQGFLSALLDLLPEARVTLLVREGYDQLAELFPDRLIWKTTRINPYKEAADPSEARLLLEELDAETYDLVLTTTYDRTWLDDLVAAKLAPSRRVALGKSEDMPDDVVHILPSLGIESTPRVYDQLVPVKEKSHETAKYQILWNRVTEKHTPLPSPQLVIPKDTAKKAEEVITSLGLNNRSFFLCFPAGSATHSLKNWPEDNFAALIAYIEKTYKLKALVAGHESEKEIIEKVAGLAMQKGADPELWLGKDGDIPLAGALVKKSSFYLGNDTGLMHMAAALNKPVLAIFGGGTWPRFLCKAKMGRAFVLPMPCFYCKWDCIFDKPLCMQSLISDAILSEIKNAIQEILEGKEDFRIVQRKATKDQLHIFFEEAVECLHLEKNKKRRSEDERRSLRDQVCKSTRLLKESESDRKARLEQVKDLEGLLKERDSDRSALLGQVNELTGLLKGSESDRKARFEQVKDLEGLLAESESDRSARLEQVKDVERLLAESESDRSALLGQVNELTGLLKESESDRSARLDQVKDLEGLLKESESDRSALLGQVNELTGLLKESESDRSARLDQVKDLEGLLKERDSDRSALLAQVNELTGLLKESESDRKARLDQVKDLERLLVESESDRSARLEQVKDLEGLLKESESDRKARLDQINELTDVLKESETDRAARLKVIEAQQADIQALRAQLAQETQGAQAAEEGWRNLEKSFAVRQARKIGLIKVKRFDSPASLNSNKKIG